MLSFFESTWPLWWMIAILVLLRWFHVSALGSENDATETARGDRDSPQITPQAI